jgi:K(+)-stimulated pyrophosphate-energized sodium pump
MSIVSLVIAPHIAVTDGTVRRGVAPVEPKPIERMIEPKVKYVDLAPAAAKAAFIVWQHAR